MEQSDPIQQPIAPYSPASAELPAPPTPATPAVPSVRTASRLQEQSSLRFLWRYRVLAAGVPAIGLALVGEGLMRGSGGAPSPNLALGTFLVLLAALLVLPIAWVNNGLPALPSWRKRIPASVEADTPTSQLPVRRGASSAKAQATLRKPSLWARLRSLWKGYVGARNRLGRKGTAIGLTLTLGLAATTLVLLRGNFTHPLAPWLWLATMLLLVLTFVGVRPWPAGASLITHDPHEPAQEPPVLQAEWLLIGAIILGAALLRLVNLDTIPAGPYIDESGRALDARYLNQGLPVNREQFVFFGTGWWGVPSFYFWLVGQSLRLFGDNLLGARVVHALAGIATVWFTYRVGRVAWSPRAGLIAGALLAVSDFAIQFSRTAGESAITLFTWTACFYFLYKGLKTRQPLDFVFSGIAGGFTLYGYASGKLLPVFMVVIALYLLVRWGLTGVKRYLPGLALLALAAGLVFAPNLLFLMTQKPGALTERSQGVSIFSEGNRDRAFAEYGTNNMGVALARQFATSYAAYDVGQERGPFYPTGQPILPVLWAALWVLGGAYMVWRLGDARYGVLALWLLGGLAGAALTNDTPSLQRAVGMVPALALIPAIFLDRIAGGSSRFKVQSSKSRVQGSKFKVQNLKSAFRIPHSALRWVANGSLALLVLLIAGQTLPYYFGPYTAKANYLEFTLAGKYIGDLDTRNNLFYGHNLPYMFGDPSPMLFLGREAPIRELGNLSEELPVFNNEGKHVHFLVSPPDDPLLTLLQSYYPDGTKTILGKPDGTAIVAAYRVSAEELDRQRYVAVRYGPAGGPLFEQQEARLGTLGPPPGEGFKSGPPASTTYPATAEWLGGLVAPAYAAYRFGLDAPAGATLEINGRQVLTATAGTGRQEARVALARGVHRVRLSGVMNDPAAQVELRWGSDSGELAPIARQFLWGGGSGALLGSAYAWTGDPSWLTAPQPPLGDAPPLLSRRDGLLSWRNVNPALRGGAQVFGVWQGRLRAPVAGDYLFDVPSNAIGSLWLDGAIVGARALPEVAKDYPVTVGLEAGEHPIELRFASQQDGSELHLYWQPPGEVKRLLTPSALAPAEGGVWTTEERPNVPSVEAALIRAVSSVPVEVEGLVPGSGWRDALGVGVMPDGRLAVGDTGNHRLLFLGADGAQRAAYGSADIGAEDYFNDLSDVAVAPDGTVAALDAENADIRLFTQDGAQIARLPREKLGLSHARGFAWGPHDGKLYVADTGGSRVVRISRDGNQEISLKEGTGEILALEQPVDVAVAPDGSVYVVDLRDRIVYFNPAGVAEREWPVPVGRMHGGSKLALWGERLAMTNPDSNTLTVLDPANGLSAQAIAPQGSTPLILQTPTGLAATPDGRLFTLDSGNGRVVVLKARP